MVSKATYPSNFKLGVSAWTLPSTRLPEPGTDVQVCTMWNGDLNLGVAHYDSAEAAWKWSDDGENFADTLVLVAWKDLAKDPNKCSEAELSKLGWVDTDYTLPDSPSEVEVYVTSYPARVQRGFGCYRETDSEDWEDPDTPEHVWCWGDNMAAGGDTISGHVAYYRVKDSRP